MKKVFIFAICLVAALTAGMASAMAGRPLSGTELRRLSGMYEAIWKGKHKARVLIRRNGTLLARSGPRTDVGRWKVRGNVLCVAFRVWTRGRYKCGTLERQGRWLVGLRKADGTPRLRMRVK
jgi:hypothetical protein